MMRQSFLAVKGEDFDIASRREEIEEIARCFGEYLAGVRSPGRTKHEALGAVGKALARARIARGDALLGYGRRLHEQTTNSTFPAGGVEQLDDGLRKLDRLLANVLPRVATDVIERVHYATYYDVRRRYVEFQKAWRMFVAERKGIPATQVAWYGKDLGDKDEWKELVKEFRASRGVPAVAEIDTEEDE